MPKCFRFLHWPFAHHDLFPFKTGQRGLFFSTGGADVSQRQIFILLIV